ncbi:MAG: glycosyltransferase family 1 protein [Pirellulaceae bacterium]
MRIGIWCDYGFTLEPSEGIGVFVDNLARGLVRADKACRVTLMAHPGQEDRLASTVAQGDGRIEVVSVERLAQPRRFAVRMLKKLARRLSSPAGDGSDTGLQRLVRRSLQQISKPNQQALSRHIDTCDVWLLPYVGLDQDFSKPTVVAIHDLVCYHFPDMLTPAKLASLKQLVARVSNNSTIAACMSQFIRDNDLIGQLALPPSRVRVLKPAVPDDFGLGKTRLTGQLPETLVSQGVTDETPFLLYPAAFRTYKNHAFLIDVLRSLRARSTTPWKLVFTGIRRPPSELQAHIQRQGMSEHTVSLGKVSRVELESLYRRAFATVVPSLYEQGSFPLMEALYCECPVASSNIPSLQEQFRCMGDSMLYFDPYESQSLVQVIEQIAQQREQIITAQRMGFQALRQNTWEKSAQGWLSVFREAVLLGEPIGAVRSQRQAA